MNNPADQAERRKVLAEDRDRLATLLDHARANADLDLGGRFAKLTPTTVTGSTPDHQYPRLPADNPSNMALMVPDEPCLGYSVNDLDPVGELHEQKASETSGSE
jgi:hypothetical protein